MFENPRTCRHARNLTTKISKILDLKSSSEQMGAPEYWTKNNKTNFSLSPG